MPSTFTENTGIELIADGEQTGAWGQRTNDNFDIVDRALNGSVSIALSGTTGTVTTGQGSTTGPNTFGQFAVLVFTGSPSGTNTVTIAPNTAQKTYFVTNSTAQTVVLSQGTGANVSVPAGLSKIVFTNGAGAGAAVFDITNTLSGNIAGNASTATALQTARTIGGVSFNGTANINLPGVNIGGNQNTTGSAASLTTPRTFTIGNTGKTFNGTANVAWSLTEIGVGTLGQQNSNAVNIDGGTIDGTVIGGSTPAAISGTTGAFSGDVTLPSLNGGPLAGFRNAIINGNFDNWQRGTSFSGNQYGADRWINGFNGTTATQSQQEFALGQTVVPNEPEYFARTVVSSVAGAGNFSILTQRVEDVRTFAGQTVTLSFFAKADAAKNIAVEFVQNFGGGGSPSALVMGIGVTTLNLTTTFQKFTVTVAIPSIAGKTLGTSGNDFLDLVFFFDAGSSFNARTNSLGQQSGTFDIAQVQLEAGSVATPFERRPVGTELALCQRYFNLIQGATLGFNPSAFAITQGITLVCPAEMRATPSMAFLSNISNANITSRTIQEITTRGARVLLTVSAGPLQFGDNSIYTADSEL